MTHAILLFSIDAILYAIVDVDRSVNPSVRPSCLRFPLVQSHSGKEGSKVAATSVNRGILTDDQL